VVRREPPTSPGRTSHQAHATSPPIDLIRKDIGIALSAAVTWLLSRFLYGIGATDVVTFVAIPLILGSVGFLAC
jgi:hypothetical protein